jgi:hypothetical protein
MPQTPIPTQKVRQLLRLYLGENFNKSQTAKRLKIARTSARRYIEAFNRSARRGLHGGERIHLARRLGAAVDVGIEAADKLIDDEFNKREQLRRARSAR